MQSGISPLSVYVIDDDAEIREALKWFLESANYKVECYSSGQAFFDNYAHHKKGCIVADIYMPEMNGIEFLACLKRQKIRLPVIMLTGTTEIRIAVQAMKAGAMNLITKPFNHLEFLEQIDQAMKQSEKLAQIDLMTDKKKLMEELTARQSQILELILQGKLNKQIAHETHLSISTIEYHRASIMKKFGVKNLASLISFLYL